MHVGRGDTSSKTEAMYFPPPRTAYEAADTSQFYVDGTGFIDFCEKSKYLGSILHYSLTSELELELIQTQMAQKPMLRAEVGMRVRCANKASAE